LAILQQTVFSPLYGFNESDKINKYLATGALAYGKIVAPADDTGILALADDYGYFLMEEVTADGPSLIEIELGIQQYEKKASASTAVTVLNPTKGNVVRTKWVSKGAGGVDIAVGNLLNISGGVYVTTAGNDGTKGKVIDTYTDSLGNVLYDVRIL
jgi:hypothetical protein